MKLKTLFRRPSNAGASNSLNSGGLGEDGAISFFGHLATTVKSFAIILAIIRIFLNLFESFGFFWIFLDSFGFLWILLNSFGSFWNFLDSFGNLLDSFVSAGCLYTLYLQAVLCRLFLQLNPLNPLESFRVAWSAWDFSSLELLSSCLGILGA